MNTTTGQKLRNSTEGAVSYLTKTTPRSERQFIKRKKKEKLNAVIFAWTFVKKKETKNKKKTNSTFP